MRRLVLPLLVLATFCASPVAIARATTPLIASLPITTPAETLAARNALVRKPVRLSEHASPARAALLSAGATLVPVAVGLGIIANTSHNAAGGIVAGSGVLLGPAAGYFDSGLTGRGTRGLALRFAAATLGITAGLATAASVHGGDIADYSGAFIVVMAGAGTAMILAVADCSLVASDVARAQRASVSLAPTVLPSGGAGLGFTVRF